MPHFTGSQLEANYRCACQKSKLFDEHNLITLKCEVQPRWQFSSAELPQLELFMQICRIVTKCAVVAAPIFYFHTLEYFIVFFNRRSVKSNAILRKATTCVFPL